MEKCPGLTSHRSKLLSNALFEPTRDAHAPIIRWQQKAKIGSFLNARLWMAVESLDKSERWAPWPDRSIRSKPPILAPPNFPQRHDVFFWRIFRRTNFMVTYNEISRYLSTIKDYFTLSDFGGGKNLQMGASCALELPLTHGITYAVWNLAKWINSCTCFFPGKSALKRKSRRRIFCIFFCKDIFTSTKRHSLVRQVSKLKRTLRKLSRWRTKWCTKQMTNFSFTYLFLYVYVIEWMIYNR